MLVPEKMRGDSPVEAFRRAGWKPLDVCVGEGDLRTEESREERELKGVPMACLAKGQTWGLHRGQDSGIRVYGALSCVLFT